MRNTIFILIIISVSCSNETKSIPVEIYGELRQIMHGGARDGVVELKDVINQVHVYGMGGTHDDHMNKSWNKTDENVDAKILGFYSTKHPANFIHHSTNSHMHYYNEVSGLSGHVDELILGEKVILRFHK